jgi:hypothetical protein
MKGTVVKGLYKERYGKYEGRFVEDEQQVYLTTDRYFEKYVLLSDNGTYEIWAGGMKKKDDIVTENFEVAPVFERLNGLVIESVQAVEEKSLIIYFETKEYFEIGLCTEFNAYNHPERFMKFSKNHRLK